MSTKNKLDKFKPASTSFEFREYPFYWIMRLGNRYTHTMELQLKQFDMNITTWRIGLILKENGAISMSEIATHAVGRLPTITKSVYRMEEKGLVSIKQNENDGRVTMVTITELGIETINTVIENTSKTINRAFSDFNKSEVETINKLLKKMFDNLSD